MTRTHNDVPSHPEFYYGLAVRDASSLEVAVYRKSDGREMCTVTGEGWSGPNGIHDRAKFALATIIKEEGAVA